MKATTQHTLFCECNHAMSYVASAAGPLTVLQCANVRCKHFGKRFEAPTFELIEIQAESKDDAQSVGAQDLPADDGKANGLAVLADDP